MRKKNHNLSSCIRKIKKKRRARCQSFLFATVKRSKDNEQMIVGAATKTTRTTTNRRKKGSRNDVKIEGNFSFNYKITKQASISINNSGREGRGPTPKIKKLK